jgi:hypothetical protein
MAQLVDYVFPFGAPIVLPRRFYRWRKPSVLSAESGLSSSRIQEPALGRGGRKERPLGA